MGEMGWQDGSLESGGEVKTGRKTKDIWNRRDRGRRGGKQRKYAHHIHVFRSCFHSATANTVLSITLAYMQYSIFNKTLANIYLMLHFIFSLHSVCIQVTKEARAHTAHTIQFFRCSSAILQNKNHLVHIIAALNYKLKWYDISSAFSHSFYVPLCNELALEVSYKSPFTMQRHGDQRVCLLSALISWHKLNQRAITEWMVRLEWLTG